HGDRHPRPGGTDRSGRDDERRDRDRRRRLRRRRVVGRGRRDGRRRAASPRRGAVDVLHARGRRPAGAGAADDRLLERLLLPPRGAGARVRRARADRGGHGRARRPAPARAARPAGAVLVVGLLRGEPRPQRDRRRGGGAVTLPLRDRLLRPRLPAGAGGGRARRRARRREKADARPLRVLAGALRPRRRAARAVRRVSPTRTLIANPFASRVSEERLRAVEQDLRPVETLLTERRGHATELARDAAGEEVWVLGGDGVVNEVLNGLRPDVTRGIVPGGHTNVLARALRRSGAGARRISLGRVNGRRFGFAAGIGVDSEAVREMETEQRARAGRRPSDLAYARTVAGRLLHGYSP